MNNLKAYGLTERFMNEATMYEDMALARIIAQYKGLYKVVTEDGEHTAEISGKLRYETEELAKFPAVGDYVMITGKSGNDTTIIHHILSRRSVFLRTAVGVSDQAQVIAANIDYVFICMSLNQNFNLNRLERYLSIAWDSGAIPVIVLTKADLSEDLDGILPEVERVASFSDVLTTSVYEDNRHKFEPYLKEGSTAAFIGSSGVGKSTLINQLLGDGMLETKEIGKGDKGRHATTGREMFPSPLGGVLIDTPGMRELGVQNADLSKSFADIEEYEKHCKFNDCTHMHEPGCAVQQAVAEGLIEERRLNSYFKLKNEASYEGLSSKQIEHQKMERMFKDVGGMKNARNIAKEKRKKK
ncbi:ribosome small subunit-dependent GTPase A [Salimicrobium halophilum]|uniref:Small ribosomal subunit biogenesis GTPase RsgA n=1 Tax=Salimicrobium halophilum TaxID=86666 RepID=A0A1G8QY45_9BACI|nr:ribosome small subunit-dependent GTPase A [Salimicrobium halophilum]SDJ09245.1 ribosome biogenesis GTPase [Salimicrobium halophilum]